MRALDRILKGRGGSQLLPLVALIRGMFRNGEQGVWYDPSDLTTLYQDAAGTTPVTAVEQPVGLMLDKSKGLVMGPELVVSQDLTNAQWAQLPATPASTTTATTLTFGGQFSGRADTISVTSGKTYLFSFEVRRVSGNTNLRIFYDSIQQTNGAVDFTVDGNWKTVSRVVFATSTLVDFGWQDRNASGHGTIELRNISVRELPGNHAFQSTSASRPVLSARYNLLTKTEQFDDAVWIKQSASITPNSILAPNGTLTADQHTSTGTNSNIYQVPGAFSSGVNYTLSRYVKAGSKSFCTVGLHGLSDAYFDLTNLTYSFSGTGAVSASIEDVGDGWRKVSATFVWGSGTTYRAYFAIASSLSSQVVSVDDYIYLWGGQLIVTNDGVGIPAYQRVNTSTDYDTAGFPLYLKTDGVDDWMQTNSINFTSTDKMTVWAGVRKLVSNVNSVFLELSTDVANAGTFAIFPTLSGGGDKLYLAQNKGSVVQGNTGNITNPSSFLLTQIIDFAQETLDGELAARINGTPTVLTYSGSASGTRNFGNYPLYLFRRGGTSLPFNGRMYGLIVRGAQSTASQIASGEKYINSKTKAY